MLFTVTPLNMLKKLLTILFICSLLLIGYYSLQTDSNSFDKEVFSLAINEHSKVIGLRSNRGGATVPYTYHYFYLDADANAPEKQTPFLITSTDDVNIQKTGTDRIVIRMDGKIFSFENEAWTQVGNPLSALKIDINANYQSH